MTSTPTEQAALEGSAPDVPAAAPGSASPLEPRRARLARQTRRTRLYASAGALVALLVVLVVLASVNTRSAKLDWVIGSVHTRFAADEGAPSRATVEGAPSRAAGNGTPGRAADSGTPARAADSGTPPSRVATGDLPGARSGAASWSSYSSRTGSPRRMVPPRTTAAYTPTLTWLC